MKRVNLYILMAMLLFSVTACKKDYLDRQPLSDISPDSFFKTEKDMQLYTNSFYSAFPNAEGVYSEDVDNVVKSELGDMLTGKRTVPASGGSWSWGELRKINYFLQNHNKFVNGPFNKKYVAIARLFRAYFYFDKV